MVDHKFSRKPRRGDELLFWDRCHPYKVKVENIIKERPYPGWEIWCRTSKGLQNCSRYQLYFWDEL